MLLLIELVAQTVKKPPTVQETQVRFLGRFMVMVTPEVYTWVTP